MKDNRGQALIEFTIILPIILIILLYIIEFGKIAINKYQLESQMDLIITLYNENKKDSINDYINNNNLTINYTKENELLTIEITKKIKTNMPLVKKILGDNIKTKRTIYEKNE